MKVVITWIVLCLLFFGAATANAQGADRAVITKRNMPAPAAAVLQAFIDDADLKAWWDVSRTLIEPEVGGVWSVSWDNWGAEKTQHAWSGIISELSERKLVITGMVMNEPDMPLFGPMTLQIEVVAGADGSVVTVTHGGYGHGGDWDQIYDLVVSGWDHVLGNMQEWFKQHY